MSDYGKTQAEFDAYFRVWGLIVSVETLFREFEQKLTKNRESAIPKLSTAAYLSARPTFTGAHPGINCSPRGEVWIRIADAGGGDYTVSVYSAAGASGGDLVAQGTAAADSTVTLAAQNDSGLSGTWPLPAAVTVVASDIFTVQLVPDFHPLLPRLLPGSDEEAHARDLLSRLFKSARGSIRGARRGFVSSLTRLLSDPANEQIYAYFDRFLDAAGDTAFLLDAQSTQSSAGNDGVVLRSRTGHLPRLDRAMEDDTEAGEQAVLQRAFSAISVEYPDENVGKFAIAFGSPEVGEAALEGTIEGVCIQGAPDAIGAELFQLSYSVDEDGEQRVDQLGIMQIEREFTGPSELGPWTLTRTLTKTADDSHEALANPNTATVTGISRTNTGNGVLYWELIETTAGVFRVSFYKSSVMSDNSDLVARANGATAGNAFVAEPMNNSRLRIQWTLGSAPADNDSGTLNLNPARVGDSFRFEIEATVKGRFQSFFARAFPGGGRVHSDTSGNETIDDGYTLVGTPIDLE